MRPRTNGTTSPRRLIKVASFLCILLVFGLVPASASAHAGHGSGGDGECLACPLSQAWSHVGVVCIWTDFSAHYHYYECGRKVVLLE